MSAETSLPVPRLPAVERVTHLIVAAVASECDPRTLEIWSRCAARSQGTIREWCRTAGVGPKATLDFARLLRALTLVRATGLRMEDMLDIADCRTLSALLRRGGFERDRPLPAIDAFLARQRFITRLPILSAVRAAVPQAAAAVSGGGLRADSSSYSGGNSGRTCRPS